VNQRRRLIACGGLAAATAAAMTPPGWQIMLSGGAMALLGLPHGASDLAVVPVKQRGSFLLAYLLVVALVVALWQVAPSLGLATLLILSAVHFALDVPAGTDRAIAWGWGLLLVGGPAVGHRSGLATLFTPLTGSADMAGLQAALLFLGGAAGLALLLTLWVKRRTLMDPVAAAGLAALLVLPPLIGFTAGFVLIHAWPQMEERRRELGCPDLPAYLRRTAPILTGAVAVVCGIALTFAAHPSAPTAILFAAIAALATPHMLVTPLWHQVAPSAARPVRS